MNTSQFIRSIRLVLAHLSEPEGVSFGPKSVAGAKAWEIFMTLAATAHNLGVSFLAYLQDRLHQAGRIPPLPDLIRERAAALNLNASWASA
jgi:hypothetical protein